MIIHRNCNYRLAYRSVAPCGHHCMMVNRNGREYFDGTESTPATARRNPAMRHRAGCGEICRPFHPRA
jgi:hypothetical protein